MSDQIVLHSGEYLVRHKEESSTMFFLKEGVLGVFDTRSGAQSAKEVQIGTIYSGELVGEMSFLDQLPRSASVKAINDCVLQVIPRERFQRIFDAQPKWYRILIVTLLERLRATNKRIRI